MVRKYRPRSSSSTQRGISPHRVELHVLPAPCQPQARVHMCVANRVQHVKVPGFGSLRWHVKAGEGGRRHFLVCWCGLIRRGRALSLVFVGGRWRFGGFEISTGTGVMSQVVFGRQSYLTVDHQRCCQSQAHAHDLPAPSKRTKRSGSRQARPRSQP